jgi:hypothetical protein
MGLYHPLDADTNLKYKLLCFLTPNKNFLKRIALAFNRDRYCHLALYLQLILFHYQLPFQNKAPFTRSTKAVTLINPMKVHIMEIKLLNRLECFILSHVDKTDCRQFAGFYQCSSLSITFCCYAPTAKLMTLSTDVLMLLSESNSLSQIFIFLRKLSWSIWESISNIKEQQTKCKWGYDTRHN